MNAYFYLSIPPAGDRPTCWHPLPGTGPCTRGAWRTEAEAHAWARAHISGYAYTVMCANPRYGAQEHVPVRHVPADAGASAGRGEPV